MLKIFRSIINKIKCLNNFIMTNKIMSSPQKLFIEQIKKWNPAQVIKFLETKKGELFLDEKHFKIIEDEEIAGPAFLLLTKEELRSYGMTGGPSIAIESLVKELKSEEQTPNIHEMQKQMEALEGNLASLYEQIQKSGE